MKGCDYHFMQSAQKMAGMGSYVKAGDRETFMRRVYNLKKIQAIDEFVDEIKEMMTKWPEIEPWMSWWTQDGVKAMIFHVYRVMGEERWNSMPDTSNAAESMHWKFYQGVGKDHEMIEGLVGLVKMLDYFDQCLKITQGM
jgi:hypothetical protein